MGKKEITIDNNLIDLSGSADKFSDDGYLFFGIDITKQKEFSAFIRTCEMLCRRSQEYTVWQQRTKMFAHNQNPDPDKDDSSNCPICGLSYEFVDPETHHHPITLFYLLVNKFQEWVDDNVLDEKVPLDLVQEVMEKHLCDEVEHIVLCKHCHEKYHNGEINIKNELQKMIDYKRSLKLDSYPTSIKELVEMKRRTESVYFEKRKEFNKESLGDLHTDISTEDLLGAIFFQMNEREFFEEQNKNKENQ